MSFTPFDPLPASDLNDIVENVEALADGTGLDDTSVISAKLVEAFFRGKYRQVAADSTPSGETHQRGWDFKNPTAVPDTTMAITFPAAFAAAPFVMVSFLGYVTSDPNSIDDFDTFYRVHVGTQDITATGFNATFSQLDGANLVPDRRIGVSWVAIGVLA